jgi:hypothetical protein
MLGGISGYGSAETDREEPRQVALVQQASTAYLKSVLYEEELTWTTFCHALRNHTQALGSVETKEPDDLKHHR